MNDDDQGAELAATLAAVQATLADHERRLFPVDRRGLPPSTGRVDRSDLGMTGDCWDVAAARPTVRGWRVICLDSGTDLSDTVYVHTPHSLVGDGVGDTVAMFPKEARVLATALLAAVDRIERRTQTVVQLRPGENPTS